MYLFPQFSVLTKVIKKTCRDQSTRILVFPAWSTLPWYLEALKLSGKVPLKIRSNLTNLILLQDKAVVHSLAKKIDTVHNEIQHYGGLNVSDTTNSILVASLRETKRKKYNPYQQKWHIYCQEKNINPATPNITNVVDFLSNLYDQSLSYSAINSAKSAFSHIILIPPYTKLSDHPLSHNMGRCI